MFRKIMLVCTGNICRSPMAEGLLRHRLAHGGIEVVSSGIAALVNRPADPLAQKVMLEKGFDITGHRAQQATQALLTSMDLILALDQTHGDWVLSRYPHLHGRVHKLGRWHSNIDIADPYGGPYAAFAQAYDEIARCTDEWVKRIDVA